MTPCFHRLTTVHHYFFQTHILASFLDRTDVQATVKSNRTVDAIPDLTRHALGGKLEVPTQFQAFHHQALQRIPADAHSLDEYQESLITSNV